MIEETVLRDARCLSGIWIPALKSAMSKKFSPNTDSWGIASWLERRVDSVSLNSRIPRMLKRQWRRWMARRSMAKKIRTEISHGRRNLNKEFKTHWPGKEREERERQKKDYYDYGSSSSRRPRGYSPPHRGGSSSESEVRRLRDENARLRMELDQLRAIVGKYWLYRIPSPPLSPNSPFSLPCISSVYINIYLVIIHLFVLKAKDSIKDRKRLHSWSWPRLGFDSCTSYVAIISFRLSSIICLCSGSVFVLVAIGSEKACSILNHLFGSRASHEIKKEASLCNAFLDSKYWTLFTNISVNHYRF